ncbi:MAG: dihydrolipoyllysine-residue acetyltransferase [Fluviicoccus sp.]|uniref:dihydrolipoyllysine-residue acetyltransferase n=1 Tax=Fluviicoccus sp. TaxID=2003552 RepID=UPI00272933AE|nr:dihydrolipoyllysine-residue acetyltransferase [Fluviicoccus sp.]MDO8330693.1 dihydrolipoyllysine-residue acetyltransferase [Fluviicoccus sp.]
MLQVVKAPDPGSDKAEVIEILVSPGQKVTKEMPLAVLESAKATMEIPCPVDGVVVEVLIKVGDKVAEGVPLLSVETEAVTPLASSPVTQPAVVPAMSVAQPAPSIPVTTTVVSLSAQPVKTPDIGSESAEVIELLVRPGQTISVDTPIAVLESAKASMEVPSSLAGVVKEIVVKVGDKVGEGAVLLLVEGTAASSPLFLPADDEVPAATVVAPAVSAPVPPNQPSSVPVTTASVHSGPAVRRLSRELGVDLGKVTPTGPKGRILKEDVFAWVKQSLTTPPVVAPFVAADVVGSGLPPLPEIDFSRWGPVDVQPLSRIQALSAKNLHRAWLHIPHVTQFDEADITELEAFRKDRKDDLKRQGVNLTVLAFLVKACARLLEEFPRFNASLATDGQSLILKQYVHVGVAVDTPNGLVVPVIRDANRKSVKDIAVEMGMLSVKARDKKLAPADMQGGCFSISSLGGIGGTAFTPIVNWPEVAILGVSRAALKPVWDGREFQPRLMLPLSLSYDHRVIDGADAARFTTRLAQVLSDIRILLL